MEVAASTESELTSPVTSKVKRTLTSEVTEQLVIENEKMLFEIECLRAERAKVTALTGGKPLEQFIEPLMRSNAELLHRVEEQKTSFEVREREREAFVSEKVTKQIAAALQAVKTDNIASQSHNNLSHQRIEELEQQVKAQQEALEREQNLRRSEGEELRAQVQAAALRERAKSDECVAILRKYGANDEAMRELRSQLANAQQQSSEQQAIRGKIEDLLQTKNINVTDLRVLFSELLDAWDRSEQELKSSATIAKLQCQDLQAEADRKEQSWNYEKHLLQNSIADLKRELSKLPATAATAGQPSPNATQPTAASSREPSISMTIRHENEGTLATGRRPAAPPAAASSTPTAAAAAATTTSPGSSAATPQRVVRNCPKCTFENSVVETHCAMCMTPLR